MENFSFYSFVIAFIFSMISVKLFFKRYMLQLGMFGHLALILCVMTTGFFFAIGLRYI